MCQPPPGAADAAKAPHIYEARLLCGRRETKRRGPRDVRAAASTFHRPL